MAEQAVDGEHGGGCVLGRKLCSNQLEWTELYCSFHCDKEPAGGATTTTGAYLLVELRPGRRVLDHSMNGQDDRLVLLPLVEHRGGDTVDVVVITIIIVIQIIVQQHLLVYIVIQFNLWWKLCWPSTGLWRFQVFNSKGSVRTCCFFTFCWFSSASSSQNLHKLKKLPTGRTEPSMNTSRLCVWQWSPCESPWSVSRWISSTVVDSHSFNTTQKTAPLKTKF